MINWPEINTLDDAMRLMGHLAKPWLLVGIMYILVAFLSQWRGREGIR